MITQNNDHILANLDSVLEDLDFQRWKAQLIATTKQQLKDAGYSEPFTFKINDVEAKKWFDSGATPYQTFRETYPQ